MVTLLCIIVIPILMETNIDYQKDWEMDATSNEGHIPFLPFLTSLYNLWSYMRAVKGTGSCQLLQV